MGGGIVLDVQAFAVESEWDLLHVNGEGYSGDAGQGPVGVTASGSIIWTSDWSEVRGGWRLCKAAEFVIVSGPCVLESSGCLTSPIGGLGGGGLAD